MPPQAIWRMPSSLTWDVTAGPDTDENIDPGQRRSGWHHRERKRSPPRTPAGTRSSTSWTDAHRRSRRTGRTTSHVSPRPPQVAEICRTGMPIGTSSRRRLEGLRMISADSSSRALAPKNACRMRSRRSDTDGESIATSSANQSPRPDPVRLDAGADRSASATAAPPRVGRIS